MFAEMMERSRFDRCLTPMGTVPISVIYGFNYPVGKGRTPPPTTSSSSTTTAMMSPSRGATRPVPVWPSSLSSQSPQAGREVHWETQRERRMKSAVTELRERERNIKSVGPVCPASPQLRSSYPSNVTLRSRELPKRSYLSSWRESVR